jgi:phosphatidylethanolamine/phosphatidyl-N-methylethanolamine N-methyltransferase
MKPKFASMVNLSRFWRQQKHRVTKHEQVIFLRRWLRHPLRMGAVAPSSKGLAELICQSLPPHALPDGIVVELGPGTGSFTHTLLEFGVTPENLWLIEMDPRLCEFLRNKFPHIHVIQGDAADVAALIPAHLHARIAAVVSGLPLINIPGYKITKIVESCVNLLQSNGYFIQFTYGVFSPLPAEKLSLCQERVGQILLNLPPASVWRYWRGH